MKYEDKINNVLIVGGTHGNEMSGIESVRNWQNKRSPEALSSFYSGRLTYALSNTLAIDKSVRFMDEDLNRLFTLDNLKKLQQQSTELNNEQSIAKHFNETYGPKDEPKTDLVIDIHNTTSNMGPTLIILEDTAFYRQLARFVKHHMPESIVLFEDNKRYSEFGYLCTLGKRGIMIEVGPQPQGLLKSAAYQQTISMTQKVLEFIELYNNEQVTDLPVVEAFHLDSEIPYPSVLVNGEKHKSAMIHPDLDGRDFELLSKGAPCFLTFKGETITWDNEPTYPHFIGEAAYYKNGLAFATANKIEF